jgi:hypothetical protein
MSDYNARPIYTDIEARIGVWSGLTIPAAYSDTVNFETMEITPPVQETERLISRMSSTRGAVIDSQQRPTEDPAAIKLTASTLTRKMLAITLGATVTDVSQSSAGVTDEVVTTVLDAWVPLANTGIEPHDTGTEHTLKNASDATIDAAKYEVDSENGMIKALHADAAGTGWKFSYTKGDRTWERYDAGSAQSSYVHITGTCTERRTGYNAPFDVWRTQLAASSAFDPSAGRHINVELSGDLIVPSVAIQRVAGALQIPSAAWAFHLRTA